MIQVVHPGSLLFTHPDPGSRDQKVMDPGSRYATLHDVFILPNLRRGQIFLRGTFLDFFLFLHDIQNLLHLPPLKFHCVGGCWNGTLDSCNYGIGCQTL